MKNHPDKKSGLARIIWSIRIFFWYLLRPPRALQELKSNPYSQIPRHLRWDARHNRQLDRKRPHILILRHLSHTLPNYNDHFLDWIGNHHPRILSRLRLRRLPGPPVSLRNTALLLPWLQDPLKERFPRIYQTTMQLQDRCRKQNIPVINSAEKLSVSIKSKSLDIIRGLGIRTAKVAVVDNPKFFNPDAHDLAYPFFIREDYHHASLHHMIRCHEDLQKVSWEKFTAPIAVEYINVQSPDGLYRKYRYILLEDKGVPRHLMISHGWFIHAPERILTPKTRDEEIPYIRADRDPNHDILNQARKKLGLDLVAFDYSYDQDGRLVVWEPNPFPVYWGPTNEGSFNEYQWPTMDRIYSNLLAYYLRKANMHDIIKAEGVCDE